MFFICDIPSLCLVYFCLFKQTLQFLQQIYVKKCPSGIRTHDLQDMSLLSRPGLPAQTLLFTYFLICHNVIYEKTSFVIFAPFTRCFLQKKSFGDLNPIVNVGQNITRTISYFQPLPHIIASHHCCSKAKNMLACQQTKALSLPFTHNFQPRVPWVGMNVRKVMLENIFMTNMLLQ